MNEELARKVRAASGATWWVLVIGVVWLSVGYVVWLAVLHCRPSWVPSLWGGPGLEWAQYQEMGLWFFAVAKLGLFGVFAAAIWLALFARRLTTAG